MTGGAECKKTQPQVFLHISTQLTNDFYLHLDGRNEKLNDFKAFC